MLRIGFIVSALVFIFAKSVFSQPDIITAKTHYGFLMPHNTRMHAFAEEHIFSTEIIAGWTGTGKRQYESDYNYPERGICLLFTSLGSKEKLGYGMAPLAYIKFKWIEKEVYQLRFRVGLGAGFVSKPFNPYNNYKNIAIGSRLNAAADFSFENNFRISPSNTVTTGLSFSHFSNGAFQNPNLGVNLVRWNIGIIHRFREVERILLPTVDNKKSELFVNFGLSAGKKDEFPVMGKKYWVSGFTADILHKPKRKHMFGLGLDLFYDASLLHNDEFPKQYDAFQKGISVVYGLALGRTSFIFQFGGYTFMNPKTVDRFYSRLSLRQYFSNNYYAFMAIKSHFGRADYIDAGLGYKLNLNP